VWQAGSSRATDAGEGRGRRAEEVAQVREMSQDERRAFLTTSGRTGVLTTVRPDGRPHAAPIWFLLDADDLVFTTWETSVKARNLARDPRAGLVVDDPAFPYAYVLVEGRCAVRDLRDDLAALRRWTTRIAARYVPADQVDAYGSRNAVAGELLVRLQPEHLVAQTEIAG
jgi:PPOX class probable F420-dependent enzyme